MSSKNSSFNQEEEGKLLNQPNFQSKISFNNDIKKQKTQEKQNYFLLGVIVLICLLLQAYLYFKQDSRKVVIQTDFKSQFQNIQVEKQYLKKDQSIKEELQKHEYEIAKQKSKKADLAKQYNGYDLPNFIKAQTLHSKNDDLYKNKNNKVSQLKPKEQNLQVKNQNSQRSKSYEYGDYVDYSKLKRMKKHKESISSSLQDLQRGLRFHQLLGKDIQSNPQLKAIAEQQKAFYNLKYNIDKYPNQLEICLIITSYNNEGKKRYLANLDSVYSQQYENYFVIYVNDASTDATGQLVQKYINQNQTAKKRTILVNNTVQKRKSQNQYQAGRQFCNLGSIMYILDGDDTIIGRQFFKLLNAIYQQKKATFVYLNYLEIKWQFNPPQLHYGYNGYIDPQVIKNRTYRESKNYPINPRTWLTDIFLNISFEDYTYHQQFVPAGQDLMLMPSLLQLSGDRIVHLPDIVYYYNTATGMNDNASKETIKYRFDLLQDVIKFEPLKQYKEKINYRISSLKQLKKQPLKITKNI